MTGSLLVDTGPLVAYLKRQDQSHEWAQVQFKSARPPLLTCEPVLAEACYLLRRTEGGVETVLNMVASRILTVPFRLEEEAEAVAALLARYANVPMSLADACLMRMAELVPRGVILTLDKDFHVYRKHGRQVIPTLMPQGG